MKTTMPINAIEMHQRTRLTVRLICRKLMDGDVANVFHKIAWLLTPRHIPNEDIGKRRRNGHFLSSGRTNSSDDWKKNNKLKSEEAIESTRKL